MFRNKIVRADGTTEVLGIKQGSFHYHSQMETSGKIQVGNVISAFVEFSFYVNVNNGVIPVGEQIKYYQVTDVNSSFVETSTISENLIGTFNVTSSNTNKNICTIVAYDNISKLNVDYSLRLKEIQNQFPMRIRDLLDEAANYVGLTSNVGHYSRVDILYTGMLPAFYSDGITVRDLFAWAGTLVGDAIYAGAQGTIYQRSYGAKYNGQPWKYSHEYVIAPTDQDEYYNPSGLQQLIPVFYKQDSFHSEEYSVIPYDCVEVYKSDGSLFATYSPSGTSNKKYVVFGNVFLDFVDTPPLSSYANLVASDIYEYLQDAVKHSPMRVSLFPFRCPYGYGSGSTTYLYDTTGEVVSIPIMSLDLTDESVIIEVFGEDEENGKHRQDFTADERATNLSAQINAVDNGKVSKSGDTMTGSLALNGKNLPAAGNYLLLRLYGNKKSKPSEVPSVSSNSPYGSISMYDVDDNRLFYNECVLNSSKTVYASYVVRRPMDDGTFVGNGFYLRVHSDGTVSVSFNTDDTKKAWVSALGLGTSGSLPITIAQGGTGATSRTNAVKALFNEAPANDTQFLLGIKGDWSKAGYVGFQRVRSLMGLGNTTGALPIANGGTGQTGLVTETTVSNVASPASSDITIAEAQYASWGKLAQIRLRFKKTTAVSSGQTHLATIVSGKRPVYGVGGAVLWATNKSVYIDQSGAVTTNGPISANETIYVTATYILP